MATLINSHKNIMFEVDDDTITNLFIQTTEQFGIKQSQIKFSIKVNGDFTDRYFLITSLKPLKVFSGLAGTYKQSHETMWDCEEEIIAEVETWDSKKLYELAGIAKFVRDYKDFV